MGECKRCKEPVGPRRMLKLVATGAKRFLPSTTKPFLELVLATCDDCLEIFLQRDPAFYLTLETAQRDLLRFVNEKAESKVEPKA